MTAAERYPTSIPLVVTDVVMPKMSGPELAEHLRKMRPETRVLFMSGYTDAIVRHSVIDRSVFFVQKPFTATMLARKVREVLDHGSSISA